VKRTILPAPAGRPLPNLLLSRPSAQQTSESSGVEVDDFRASTTREGSFSARACHEKQEFPGQPEPRPHPLESGSGMSSRNRWSSRVDDPHLLLGTSKRDTIWALVTGKSENAVRPRTLRRSADEIRPASPSPSEIHVKQVMDGDDPPPLGQDKGVAECVRSTVGRRKRPGSAGRSCSRSG